MLRSTISWATESSSRWQPAGRNGNPLLHLPFDVLAAPAEQRAEAPIEAELLVMQADEVEHRADAFSHAHGADRGRVAGERASGCPSAGAGAACRQSARRAFIEQIDGKDHAHRPAGQIAKRALRAPRDGLSPQTATDGSPASLNTLAMNRACWTLTQKPERPHPPWIVDLASELAPERDAPRHDRPSGRSSSAVDVVAGAAPPWNLAQVEPVVDCRSTTNGARYCWSIASQSRSSAAIRPSKTEHVEAVGPLGRRGEPKQLVAAEGGRAAPDTSAPRRGGTRRRSRRRSASGSIPSTPEAARLWIEAKTWSNRVGRCPPTHISPNAASRMRVAGRSRRLCTRISSRWATNSRRSRSEHRPEARVVDCSHDRLTRASRGDEEVAVNDPSGARDRQLLEQSLLERARFDLDRAKADYIAALLDRRAPTELVRIVWDEVAALPITRRRPLRSWRARRDYERRTARTFHSRPVTWAEWVRFDEPT